MLRWLFGSSAPTLMGAGFLTPQAVVADMVPGSGEDSAPLAMAVPDGSAVALAVFDGLGGSGARLVTGLDGSQRTAAAEASALAAKVAAGTLSGFGFVAKGKPLTLSSEQGSLPGTETLNKRLQKDFEAALSDAALQLQPIDRGAVRGTIAKRLPTTACILLAQAGQGDGNLALAAMWAGDSRAFAWSARRGLQQITEDHTRVALDALQAIFEDPPMSNFLSPDIPSFLDLRTVSVPAPCLFLCGSDGAFNYFASPMEFEAAILSALLAAREWSNVADCLLESVLRVAQDDVSFAICGYGYDWQLLRHDAEMRLRELLQLLDPILTARTVLAAATEAAEEATRLREERLTQLRDVTEAVWNVYRTAYEALQPSPSADNGADGAC